MRIPDYTVTRSPKAKNIRLKVTPQEGLVVVIPRGFDEDRIPAILNRKKVWIAEKLKEAVEKRRFLEPKPMVHLPEHLPLRALNQEWRIVYREDDAKTGLWLRSSGRDIILAAPAFERDTVISKLKEWLRLTVREELFPLAQQIARKNGFGIRDLMVKSQRTRWASCSLKKNLSLNIKLLFIPPDLVRYVITHELCHTVHMNHSSEFWRLVACHEPAYRTLDNALREAWKKVPAWAL
ncbi:MAG: SprT family zinc-dependent metalloprotease [Planctomycetota bacterium]